MDLSRKLSIFRSRFHGRQDVFGHQYPIRDENKNVVGKGYAPVCSNFFSDVCHIKNKTNISCGECTHREWEPTTDASVRKHIDSIEIQNIFVIQLDGTIRFGAIDFDVKAGKEAQGYDWSEVVKVTSILKTQGIPHGIARSTSAGYHVYIFFAEPYPAAKFRAVINRIFKAAGFDEYLKERVKNQLPEVFPKQDYIDANGLGSAIKPPMIETQILIGRNCFVDDNDVVIGDGLSDEEKIDAQWGYLESVPSAGAEVFDRMIEMLKLQVGQSKPKAKRESLGEEWVEGKGDFVPFGHVEKVIYGCDAFKGLFESARTTGRLSHQHGFALYHMAMNTVDGKEWFLKNTPWGNDPRELRQLEQSEAKGYRPWSCSKMMEIGLCTKTVMCAEAAPKGLTPAGVAADDGTLEGLSDEEQKKFNPYRFSFGPGDELLHQLLKEVGDLAAEPEAVIKEEKLRDILQRLQVLDRKKQRDFRAQLELVQKQLKIPKNKTAPMFKAAEQDHLARVKENLGSDPTVFPVESKTYRKRMGGGKYGYAEIKASKTEMTETLLCEADIDILEMRTYMGESAEETATFYYGVAKGPAVESSFNINSDIWANDQKFQLFFTRILGTAFTPLRANLELIKQASIGWAREMGTKTVIYLTSQGFYEDRYLMPSVIADRTGLRPNETNPVDLSMKHGCKHLDFTILPEDEFIATLAHIKNEFMVAWPEEWTHFGLSHVLLPIAIHKFGWNVRPTFFLDGITGSGKTAFTMALQQFWGNFDKLVSLGSTEKYLSELAYEFKDACVVFDDFKGISRKQEDSVLHTIQYGFDGNVSGKLNRDSTLKKAHGNRSVMVMSGERFIQNQSSVVARTLLLEVKKFDVSSTSSDYASVLATQEKYRGVTPRFISWMLNVPSEPYAEELKAIQKKLLGPVVGRQNAARVSNTFACNHLVFKLWTRFLHEHGVATAEDMDEMNKTHLRLVNKNYLRMLDRCEDEQEGVTFKDMLLELILSGSVSITGSQSEFKVDNKPILGLWNPHNPRQIFMYPALTFKLVTDSQRGGGGVVNKRATMRQLVESKIIVDCDPDGLTKVVRLDGKPQRVMVIDAVALGLMDAPSQAPQYPIAVPPLSTASAKLITIRPGIEAALGSDGIF